jgi:hypothetical protein
MGISLTSHSIVSHVPQAKRAFAPKLKAKILKKWNQLTETDVDSIPGSFNLLSKKIQEVYTCSQANAERECSDFRHSNRLA